MSDAPLAIRQKLEVATLAYLRARIAAAGPNALTYLVSRNQLLARAAVADVKFPRVIAEALSAPAYEDMNELYMVSFGIYLATQGNESEDTGPGTPPEKHAARNGLLAEFLADREGFKAYVNTGAQPWLPTPPPAPAPPVPDLHVYDILLESEDGEQTGNYWFEVLTYLVPCQLVDNPPAP